VAQVMESSEREQLTVNDHTMLSQESITAPPNTQASAPDDTARPPDILEDVYIHRIDNLLAKVQKLREASTKASLTMPRKTTDDRSPFREGSPLAPSKSDSSGQSSSDAAVDLHSQEYQKLVDDFRYPPEERHRSSSAQRKHATISPKMISLEYQARDVLPAAVETQKPQTNPKSPIGYEYFGIVDFQDSIPSPPQRRGSKDPGTFDSTEEPASTEIAKRHSEIWNARSRSPRSASQTRDPNSRNLSFNARNLSPLPYVDATRRRPVYHRVGVYDSSEDMNGLNSFHVERELKGRISTSHGHRPFNDHDLALDAEQSYRDDRLQCPTCHKIVRSKSELK